MLYIYVLKHSFSEKHVSQNAKIFDYFRIDIVSAVFPASGNFIKCIIAEFFQVITVRLRKRNNLIIINALKLFTKFSVALKSCLKFIKIFHR